MGSLGSLQNQSNHLSSYQMQPRDHLKTMNTNMNTNMNKKLMERYKEHKENIPEYSDQVLNYKNARAGN